MQAKYPILIILLVLTVTAFLGYYAVRIETDSNFEVMLRDDSQAIILSNLIDSEFGGTDTLFVLAKIDADVNDKTRVQDIRHPDVLKAMKDLKQGLMSETYTVSAYSLADLMEIIYGRLPSTLEESKQMISNFPDEIKDKYLGRLLSEDYAYQNMIVSVSIERTPGFLEKIEDNAKQKIDQTPFPIGVSAELTGVPMLYNVILTYLINDNIKTIFLAIGGVFFVLWFYFRSWKIALFSSIPVLLTLIWLSGTMYLLDIRITVITASVGAMIIGMSVDYAIHLTHRYHSRVKEGMEEPIEDTVVGVGAALVASVLTTIAGFSAMTLGVSPNSVIQGTVLGIGIAYAFITSMLILPPLMLLQRKFIYSKLDQTMFKIVGRTESGNKNIIDKFLSKLAHLQVNRPLLVLTYAFIFTLLIIPGFGLVYLDIDDDNWIPDGDTFFDGFNTIAYNFGGTDSMNLIFMIDGSEDGDYDQDSIRDLRDPRVMKPMSSLDILVEDLRWVESVDSPSAGIKSSNDGRIPQNLGGIRRVLEKNQDARNKFNDDFSIALFTIWASGIDREDYFELMNELDGVAFPKEVSIIPQGPVPEDIEFEKLMASDTMRTTSIGFALIIVLASLFFFSIVAGLLAFIPIIFAILWTVGIMGYINLPFTVLTTGMLAILMGMGIDFSIHMIHSIKDNQTKLGSMEKAIPEALMSTGQAISTTTITTIIGFMALSFATLVNTMRLGWTLALGILATFFSCILIVPAALSLQDKLKSRRSKK